MFRKYLLKRLYVQKVLYSEGPMFRRSYVQKVLYSEGFMFRRSYVQKIFVQKVLYSEDSMIRRSYIQIFSEGPIFRKKTLFYFGTNIFQFQVNYNVRQQITASHFRSFGQRSDELLSCRFVRLRPSTIGHNFPKLLLLLVFGLYFTQT